MTGVQTCALPICFPVTIGLLSAEKMGKFEHIRLLNTDLRRGRIKFREHSEWITEVSKLKKKTKAKEGENGKVTMLRS